MKARLTAPQVVAAVIAGSLGHVLFGTGWALLGVVILGGALTGLLGLTAGGIAQLFSGAPARLFDEGGVVGGVFAGAAAAALVLMLLGFLVSGWILMAGKVRKPWATTFSSDLISVVLSVPLLSLFVAISGRGEGGLPFPLVALLGSLIVGVLVWLWMTWAHRGPAVEDTSPDPEL